MKALIIGATGATGKDLVNVLIADPDYHEVVIFVRRHTGLVNPKLVEIITDFDNIQNVAEHINGDVWFSCLGTTIGIAGSKEKQWKIDHGIPLKFAQVAKANGIPTTVLLSAYSADVNSKVFYSKMKGQLEEDLKPLGFERYIIFRPGLLLRKDTDRVGERIAGVILKALNSIAILRSFRPITTLLLAVKLAKAPKVLPSGTHAVLLNDIFEL